jgi:hypothetical protein
MGGQTDAMKTYRENQMKIGAGGAKPMSPTESATYSQLEKQGMSGSPDESLKSYLNAAQGMYGDLRAKASTMISPNLFGRDVSAPATQEQNK